MPTAARDNETRTFTTLPDIFRTINGVNLDIGPLDHIRDGDASHDVSCTTAPERADFPRIVLRDALGRELDTFTTLQEAIYRAKWNVKRTGQAKTPLEWRLPKAPVPARPDLTRTCPPMKHPTAPTKVTKPSSNWPSSRVMEFDVEDVGFVQESLQHLPYVPSLSFLRQEILVGPKTYFQIVGTMLLHKKIMSPTEKRQAIHNFPGFCTGCIRMGLCYGCERGTEPHYHEDKPVRTGGGFTYFKKDRPEKELPSRNPVNWKIHHPDLVLKSLMEEFAGVDLEGDIPTEIQNHLDAYGGRRVRHASHIPNFASEMEEHRARQREAELEKQKQNEGILPDINAHKHDGEGSGQGQRSSRGHSGQSQDGAEGQGQGSQGDSDINGATKGQTDNDLDSDGSSGRHGNRRLTRGSGIDQHGIVAVPTSESLDGYKSKSTERYNSGANIGDGKSVRSDSEGRRGGSYDRYRHRLPKYRRNAESGDDGENEEESEAEEGESNEDRLFRRGRRKQRLYTAPPAFKLKKSPSRRTTAKSPFSTERSFDLPKGKGINIKKSDRPVTEFKDFKNVDASWKAPKKFELKKQDHKSTKFWAGPPKKKEETTKGRRTNKFRRVPSPRAVSPDSGLDSEFMTAIVRRKPVKGKELDALLELPPLRKKKKSGKGREPVQTPLDLPPLRDKSDTDVSNPSNQPTNQVALDGYGDTATKYYNNHPDIFDHADNVANDHANDDEDEKYEDIRRQPKRRNSLPAPQKLPLLSPDESEDEATYEKRLKNRNAKYALPNIPMNKPTSRKNRRPEKIAKLKNVPFESNILGDKNDHIGKQNKTATNPKEFDHNKDNNNAAASKNHRQNHRQNHRRNDTTEFDDGKRFNKSCEDFNDNDKIEGEIDDDNEYINDVRLFYDYGDEHYDEGKNLFDKNDDYNDDDNDARRFDNSSDQEFDHDRRIDANCSDGDWDKNDARRFNHTGYPRKQNNLYNSKGESKLPGLVEHQDARKLTKGRQNKQPSGEIPPLEQNRNHSKHLTNEIKQNYNKNNHAANAAENNLDIDNDDVVDEDYEDERKHEQIRNQKHLNQGNNGNGLNSYLSNQSESTFDNDDYVENGHDSDYTDNYDEDFDKVYDNYLDNNGDKDTPTPYIIQGHHDNVKLVNSKPTTNIRQGKEDNYDAGDASDFKQKKATADVDFNRKVRKEKHPKESKFADNDFERRADGQTRLQKKPRIYNNDFNGNREEQNGQQKKLSKNDYDFEGGKNKHARQHKNQSYYDNDFEGRKDIRKQQRQICDEDDYPERDGQNKQEPKLSNENSQFEGRNDEPRKRKKKPGSGVDDFKVMKDGQARGQYNNSIYDEDATDAEETISDVYADEKNRNIRCQKEQSRKFNDNDLKGKNDNQIRKKKKNSNVVNDRNQRNQRNTGKQRHDKQKQNDDYYNKGARNLDKNELDRGSYKQIKTKQQGNVDDGQRDDDENSDYYREDEQFGQQKKLSNNDFDFESGKNKHARQHKNQSYFDNDFDDRKKRKNRKQQRLSCNEDDFEKRDGQNKQEPKLSNENSQFEGRNDEPRKRKKKPSSCVDDFKVVKDGKAKEQYNNTICDEDATDVEETVSDVYADKKTRNTRCQKEQSRKFNDNSLKGKNDGQIRKKKKNSNVENYRNQRNTGKTRHENKDNDDNYNKGERHLDKNELDRRCNNQIKTKKQTQAHDDQSDDENSDYYREDEQVGNNRNLTHVHDVENEDFKDMEQIGDQKKQSHADEELDCLYHYINGVKRRKKQKPSDCDDDNTDIANERKHRRLKNERDGSDDYYLRDVKGRTSRSPTKFIEKDRNVDSHVYIERGRQFKGPKKQRGDRKKEVFDDFDENDLGYDRNRANVGKSSHKKKQNDNDPAYTVSNRQFRHPRKHKEDEFDNGTDIGNNRQFRHSNKQRHKYLIDYADEKNDRKSRHVKNDRNEAVKDYADNVYGAQFRHPNQQRDINANGNANYVDAMHLRLSKKNKNENVEDYLDNNINGRKVRQPKKKRFADADHNANNADEKQLRNPKQQRYDNDGVDKENLNDKQGKHPKQQRDENCRVYEENVNGKHGKHPKQQRDDYGRVYEVNINGRQGTHPKQQIDENGSVYEENVNGKHAKHPKQKIDENGRVYQENVNGKHGKHKKKQRNKNVENYTYNDMKGSQLKPSNKQGYEDSNEGMDDSVEDVGTRSPQSELVHDKVAAYKDGRKVSQHKDRNNIQHGQATDILLPPLVKEKVKKKKLHKSRRESEPLKLPQVTRHPTNLITQGGYHDYSTLSDRKHGNDNNSEDDYKVDADDVIVDIGNDESIKYEIKSSTDIKEEKGDTDYDYEDVYDSEDDFDDAVNDCSDYEHDDIDDVDKIDDDDDDSDTDESLEMRGYGQGIAVNIQHLPNRRVSVPALLYAQRQSQETGRELPYELPPVRGTSGRVGYRSNKMTNQNTPDNYHNKLRMHGNSNNDCHGNKNKSSNVDDDGNEIDRTGRLDMCEKTEKQPSSEDKQHLQENEAHVNLKGISTPRNMHSRRFSSLRGLTNRRSMTESPFRSPKRGSTKPDIYGDSDNEDDSDMDENWKKTADEVKKMYMTDINYSDLDSKVSSRSRSGGQGQRNDPQKHKGHDVDKGQSKVKGQQKKADRNEMSNVRNSKNKGQSSAEQGQGYNYKWHGKEKDVTKVPTGRRESLFSWEQSQFAGSCVDDDMATLLGQSSQFSHSALQEDTDEQGSSQNLRNPESEQSHDYQMDGDVDGEAMDKNERSDKKNKRHRRNRSKSKKKSRSKDDAMSSSREREELAKFDGQYDNHALHSYVNEDGKPTRIMRRKGSHMLEQVTIDGLLDGKSDPSLINGSRVTTAKNMFSPPLIPSDVDFDKKSMTSHEPDLDLTFEDAIDVPNLELVEIDEEEDERKKKEERRRRRHKQKKRRRREEKVKEKEEKLKQMKENEDGVNEKDEDDNDEDGNDQDCVEFDENGEQIVHKIGKRKPKNARDQSDDLGETDEDIDDNAVEFDENGDQVVQKKRKKRSTKRRDESTESKDIEEDDNYTVEFDEHGNQIQREAGKKKHRKGGRSKNVDDEIFDKTVGLIIDANNDELVDNDDVVLDKSKHAKNDQRSRKDRDKDYPKIEVEYESSGGSESDMGYDFDRFSRSSQSTKASSRKQTKSILLTIKEKRSKRKKQTAVKNNEKKDGDSRVDKKKQITELNKQDNLSERDTVAEKDQTSDKKKSKKKRRSRSRSLHIKRTNSHDCKSVEASKASAKKKNAVDKDVTDEEIDFQKLPSIQSQLSKIQGQNTQRSNVKGYEDKSSDSDDVDTDEVSSDSESDHETVTTSKSIKDMDPEERWEFVRPKSVDAIHNIGKGSVGVSKLVHRSRSYSMPTLTDIQDMLDTVGPEMVEKLKMPLKVPIYLPGFPRRSTFIMKKQFKPKPKRVKGRERSMSIAVVTNMFQNLNLQDSNKSELEPLREETWTPSPEPPKMDKQPTPSSLRLPTPEKPRAVSPIKKKEIVKKEKKLPFTPPTPRQPSPIVQPSPSPEPSFEEAPVSREITFDFIRDRSLPELPPVEVPDLPELGEKESDSDEDSSVDEIDEFIVGPRVSAKSDYKGIKRERKLIEVAPELAELKKKLPPPPKQGPRIPRARSRKSKVAEAPVTTQELQQLGDPLDFLAKYCIINPDRLPYYERVFNGAVSDQTPRYNRDPSPTRGGAMVQLPPAQLSRHEIQMLHDLTVLNHAQSPRREGMSAPEQYLEKLNYSLEFIRNKMDLLQDDMHKLQVEKMHQMAAMAKEMDRDIVRLDYKTKGKKKKKDEEESESKTKKEDQEKKSAKKKKKKKVDVVDFDTMGAMAIDMKNFQPTKASDITDEVIVSRMDDKMLKKVKKDPQVKQLNMGISRDIEKLKHFDERVSQIEDEKDLVGLYCMDYYFSEQVNASRPQAFRRQQSRLYQKLHPNQDIEMNIEEVETALQTINNKLLTEKEFQYIYFILDLPKREKINFRLFSIVAALSEKVTQMDPVIRKLINKVDYNALDIKMEKSKELFELLQDETNLPVGNAPASTLAVELTAGGLTPEHTNYVLSKFNREGKGFIDFMDFVTYVPLFVEIHQRIIKDPFNDSLDV